MDIDWVEARRLMLTDAEVMPSPPWEEAIGSLEAAITPEQVGIAERCLRVLHQGLQWASRYEINLKAPGAREPVQHFFIEDEHVIGVFRDCFRLQADHDSQANYPSSLREYLELQARGEHFIVADLVLEKENFRLVNRWGQNKQSKFLRDLVFPGFMGIVAHYSGLVEQLEGPFGRDCCQLRDRTTQLATTLAVAGLGDLLTRELLLEVLYNAESSDLFLASHSPLALFYDAASPFNLNLSQVGSLVTAGGYGRPSARKRRSAGPIFPKNTLASRSIL